MYQKRCTKRCTTVKWKELPSLAQKSNTFELKIEQVEVLRKRTDAVVPCDDNTQNNDRMYREAIMKNVGCIPAFWDIFTSNLSSNGNPISLPECQSKKEYKKFTNYTADQPGYMNKAQELYMQPCKQMTITYVVEKENYEEKGNDKIYVTINYIAQTYKLICNTREFSLKDLWSQIGGFVGIFLGYSLLQLPDLLYIVWGTWGTLKKSKTTDRSAGN